MVCCDYTPLRGLFRKFCDSQVRKVIRTVLTFDPRDSLEWRECAEALIDVSSRRGAREEEESSLFRASRSVG